MRQTTLIALLAVLLVVAAAAAWFFLRPGHQVTINAASELAALTNDANPLSLPANNAALPTPDPRPDPLPRPQPEDPNATPEPSDGEWQIRGKIELAPEVLKLVPKPLESNADVNIAFLADAREPQETAHVYATLDESFTFRSNISAGELNLADEDPLPPGKWQLVYAFEGDLPPMLYDLDEVPLAKLPGVTTPKISGRVIDFGTISVGLDMFFYHRVIITGRLVHTSGRALAYSGAYYLYGIRKTEEDEYWIEADVHVRENGEFHAMPWADSAEDPSLLPEHQWTLESQNDVESVYAEDDTLKLPKPAVNGRHVAFGDITLPGALIELVLKGDLKPTLNAQGKLDISLWGDYEGDYADISFEGSGVYADAWAYPQPYTTVMLLPEGRYVWSAYRISDGFYPYLHGVLLARDGQVHRLELGFKPYPSIPLTVKADGDLTNCGVQWNMLRGETEVADGSYGYTDGSRVPVADGCETSVTVSCPGFMPAEAVAKPGMAGLEVTLEKDDRPFTKLIVVVPAFPAALLSGDVDADVRVEMKGWSAGASDNSWGKAPTELTYYAGATGAGTVTLYGGQNWGYQGNILCGPVSFEIAVGETKRIELPAIAEPLWPAPMSNVRVRAATSGRPITLEASVRYRDVAQPIGDTLRDQDTIPVHGLALALTDGREDYPLQFTLPGKIEAGRAFESTLSFDLPHTIEVRLNRAGQPVTSFHVSAERQDVKAPDLKVQCDADAVDGVAYLWIPRGKVNLNVTTEGSYVANQQVEVTPGSVLQVEIGSAMLRLTLEVPAGEYDPDSSDYESPQLWVLEQSTDEGWADWTEFSQTQIHMVEPGRYRAVPWSGGEPIEFDVNEDKTVRLPELAAPKLGTLVLKYDVASLGSAYAEADFYYTIVSKLKPGQRWIEENWAPAALVPDGIKLAGLPMETEIVVWGGAWVFEDDEEGYELLLRPLKLRVTKENQLVEATLKRGIELGEEWQNFESCWLTGIENFTPSLGGNMPPGRHEIGVYQGDELVYREWVTFPESSEEPFKIPDSLRRELETRELIAPREDDE